DHDHLYEVRVTCDAPPSPREMKVTLQVPPLPGETNTDNNAISTYVTVTKEGISVLFVEGALSVDSALISDALSKHRSIRVYKAFRLKDEPLGADSGDWFKFKDRHYDVIIIGDISARRFSGGDQQVLKNIRDMVKKDGTGLLMLGGFETFG